MDGEEFLNSLKKGKHLYGTAILSTSPLWPLAVKRTGVDFVFIDTEHIPIDRTTLSWMCQAYKAYGVLPLVRTPTPDPQEVYKVLDGGASGVLVPYIESVEQVRQLVGAVKFRPLKGKRLQKALQNQDSLEPELKKFLKDYNKNNFLIINIESVPALEKLDELLAVPGIAAIIIGPNDLSISLGVPEQYNHPRFKEAVRNIISKAREKGLGAGIHLSEAAELQIKWAKAGANIILHSSDYALFGQRLIQDITNIRNTLGEGINDSQQDKDIIV